MHNLLDDMEAMEARIHAVAPMGYLMALNIRYLTPEYFRSTYPEEWVRTYNERRYALFDPIVLWCRFKSGTVRWSDIDKGFFQGVGGHVFQHAAKFGLNYGGGVSSCGVSGASTRCLLFGARSDREMTDGELGELEAILDTLIGAVGKHAGLKEVELEALRDIAAGMTHNEIADRHKISPATVKKRIERARTLLGAKNAVHAVAIATKRGLILQEPTF